MDPRYTAEILKTCESIGFSSEEKYIAEPDWEVCVKDLILYLRRDDDDHSTRRLLGQAQVVGRDLLPLFKHYAEDTKIWEVALRLLVNLTHPALLLYDEEVPKNKKYLSYYHQLEAYLRSYKEAFVDKIVWKTMADKLKQLLDLEWDKRMEQDKLTIERILILIRNVLHVPADPTEEKRADDDTSLHDRILLVMHCSGMMDLLLFTASADSTQEYSLLVLEIMSWMLREQTGEQLARTQLARNEEDKVKDERELIRMREKEEVLKQIQLQKLPTRHSRFGGTFVVRDMKAPSGKDMLCHKPISSVNDLNLDEKKKRKKVASHRKPIVGEDTTRRSTISVRIILKEFCAAILADNKYSKMMVLVKDNINRGRVEDNDETYYLWALKFFMEFNRHSDRFLFRLVIETMNTHTFHYVQTLLDKYQGMMVTDKEKIAFWSRRTHMALRAYQELLFTLLWMDKDERENVRDASRAIKSNVFYLPEYRELCLGLLHTYEPVKLSKLYLKDLIETNHLFLKMLQDYSSANRRVMIKCKGKKKKSTKESKKKKARKGAPSGSSRPVTMSSSQLVDAWAASVSGEISSALLSSSGRSEVPGEAEAGEEEESASINANVIPFDAASDVPIDEQKGTAVERIAVFLHTGKLREAGLLLRASRGTAVERIAVFLHTGKLREAGLLLRASREVWPTDPEYFGEQDFELADEIELLKTIFMEKANVPMVKQARTCHHEQQQKDGPNNSDEVEDADSRRPAASEDDRERAAVIGEENEEEGEEDEEDEEDEEEETRVAEMEQEFDFRGFLLKYAMARVVANYALLFQDWDTLKPLTLHAILKMFHRFAFDMGYPALVCQASLLLTFKKILQVVDHRSDLKEVKQFFLHFWPKFVKLCENKRMFVEILFWKTAREAQEIQDGYADLQGPGGGKKKRSDWTKEEETELGLLVELYQDTPEEVKKAQTLLDYIMERWTWRPRSKKMFQNKLVEKELVDPAEFAKKKRAPKTWSAHELEKLRELFDEHRGAEDIMAAILSGMEMKRSRKSVVEKMVEMELIRDKSEVKKKRTGGGSRGSRQYKSASQVERDDSDSDNENAERSEQREERGSGSSSSSSDSESDRDANESSDDDSGDHNNRASGTVVDEDENVAGTVAAEVDDSRSEVSSALSSHTLKKKLTESSDDEDEDVAATVAVDDSQSEVSSAVSSRTSKRKLSDSSDDEDEKTKVAVDADDSRSEVSSAVSSHASKRKLSEGSEDEENDDVVGMTVKKRRAVIIDSDDD